jgi:putative hemolysin
MPGTSPSELTYATSAASRAGRAVIRTIEAASGRSTLMRRAEGFEQEVARGRSFWQVMPERFGLSLEVTRGALETIPRQGPLILIANHPYGILDGLMMGHILDALRGDFRILANSVFCKSEVLDRVILPIDFSETRAALQLNLETRAKALKFLGEGGAVGVFPGGTVSTSARLFSRPMDPGWRGFTARMIAKSGATVVPIFFEGQNSRLFQLASHLHSALRLGLLIREFRARLDTPVRIAVGQPLTAADLRPLAGDAPALMRHLRRTTYALSPNALPFYEYGHEFEAKHRIRQA